MATKNFNLDTSSDLGGANASDYIVARGEKGRMLSVVILTDADAILA